MPKIHDISKDYQAGGLNQGDLASDPMQQFQDWFNDALLAKVPELNAMTLATADRSGTPNARIVLLKEYSSSGFVFFTNYNSVKAREIEQNPKATLLFWWQPLARQVRATGHVIKTESSVSDRYFSSRKRQSNIGAHASQQSEIIANRQVLEEAYYQFEKEFADHDTIPRPNHWGGYQLIPEQMEFWSGSDNRLHDRFQYRRQGEEWVIHRLAP